MRAISSLDRVFVKGLLHKYEKAMEKEVALDTETMAGHGAIFRVCFRFRA